MGSRRWFRQLLCLLWSVAAITGIVDIPRSLAQDQTTITLDSISLEAGETGIVTGTIDCAVGQCGAFAITIHFDPLVVRIDRAEVGEALGTSVFPVENIIDNETGVVRLAAVALGDDVVTEETVLLRLHLTAGQSGTTLLRIVESEVGDLEGNQLETDSVDGEVIVGSMTTELATPDPSESNIPCTIRAETRGIPVRVGVGLQRGVRGSLTVGVEVEVVGQVTDSADNVWWQIHPPGYDKAEADRYWVLADDVVSSGDCEAVPTTSTSPLILSIPTRRQETTDIGSPSGSGTWGACGSCATCGYSANECVLAPDGACVWDPATCHFDGEPWPRGIPCSVAYAEVEPYYTQLRQTVPPVPAKYDLNRDGFLDIHDISLILSRCS